MAYRVVYTAIFGDYDRLRQPRVISADTNYYLVTDIPLMSIPSPWRIKTLPKGWNCPRDPIRRARWCKTHPGLLFPRAETTVWLDGNICLLTTVEELERFAFWKDLKGHLDIGLFAHPHRSCIYTEASACISLRKDDPEVIKAHVERYRQDGYPSNAGLVATGVVVRRPTAQVRILNHAWWDEISQGSSRDQLSFNYVARKLGVQYGILPGNIFDSPFVRVKPHAV